MKALDMLFALHRWDICKGKGFLGQYNSVEIIQGELKPDSLYYHTFHKDCYLDEPDVILTMNGGKPQYLYWVQ